MTYTNLRNIGELILTIDLETALEHTILDITNYFDADTIREFMEDRGFTEAYYMSDLNILIEDIGARNFCRLLQASPHFSTKDKYILVDGTNSIRTMSEHEYNLGAVKAIDGSVDVGLDFLGWAKENNKRAELLGFVLGLEEDLVQLWDVDRVDIEVNNVAYRGLRCKD